MEEVSGGAPSGFAHEEPLRLSRTQLVKWKPHILASERRQRPHLTSPTVAASDRSSPLWFWHRSVLCLFTYVGVRSCGRNSAAGYQAVFMAGYYPHVYVSCGNRAVNQPVLSAGPAM
ncbi:unnamed protein product [Pleuronectes platessa]|uniref:Uncharacterized protein n=1 Tax=Pleuronectes platessa TaxID=8262 RepID=A0A9N7YIQ5_PLEPL|nr:unnamed protein product [Pleuronectes platessa]